jgi:hypothetical protein
MRIRALFSLIIAMQQSSNVSIGADGANVEPFRFEQRKGALLDALSCGVDKSKKGRSRPQCCAK